MRNKLTIKLPEHNYFNVFPKILNCIEKLATYERLLSIDFN